MSRVLRIGTRASLLARAQSRVVLDALRRAGDGSSRAELVPVFTRGDRDLSVPLAQSRDPDFFSAELDAGLLSGELDFCVHSLKDLPPSRPSGVALAALPAREDPRDVIVFRDDVTDRLDAGLALRLGTSSDRRQHNVADFLIDALPATGRPPVLDFQPLRGAVDRRVARLGLPADDREALDGVVLALAGLNRLCNDRDGCRALGPLLAGVRFMVLPLSRCPAAPGQGVLAVECRRDDAGTRSLLGRIHVPQSAALVDLERESLEALPDDERPAAGATAVVHPVLGPVCFVRGRRQPAAGGGEANATIVWQRPVRAAGRVSAWDGIAWQRACTRRALPVSLDLPARSAVFVAYWHAATSVELPRDARLWVSGVESWRRLAAAGLWVEGCGDNLGFDSIVPTLTAPALDLPPLHEWTALTYASAVPGWQATGIGRVVATYEILPPAADDVEALRDEARRATHCYWSSPEQFRAIGPLPAGIHHACGAGKTLAALRAAGIDATPFPDSREWRRWLN